MFPFFIGPYSCFSSLIYEQFRESQINLGWKGLWEGTCSELTSKLDQVVQVIVKV